MQPISFSPFPVFTTERLLLRQLTDTDNSALSALRSDEQVNQYIQRPKQRSLAEAMMFIEKINNNIAQNKWLYWAICLKQNPELIGTICLWNFSEEEESAEIGYELNPTFHKQGIMTEAFASVIPYTLQTLGLKKLEAYTHKENSSSIRLLEKHNFKAEPGKNDPENADFIIYSRIL